MRKSVAVIDYGMGNLHSVVSAVAHEAPDREIFITADAARIRAADHVIFPGVGAIRDCMHEIRRFGIDIRRRRGSTPVAAHPPGRGAPARIALAHDLVHHPRVRDRRHVTGALDRLHARTLHEHPDRPAHADRRRG